MKTEYDFSDAKRGAHWAAGAITPLRESLATAILLATRFAA
jgi:hypothetical protein